MVCGSLVVGTGSEDYRDDGVEGVAAGGDIGGGSRNGGRVYGHAKAQGRREKRKREVISWWAWRVGVLP